MAKKLFTPIFILSLFFLIISSNVFATIGKTGQCIPTDDQPNHGCDTGLFCKPFAADATRGSCEANSVENIFGKITAPAPLAGFIKGDQTGAAGISSFLSNLIALIYTMAAIALIFMILWGAFEWMTSGGDKEKVEKARNRIINAIIAILIFAAAFAILDVLGTFTGFKFFEPIKPQLRDSRSPTNDTEGLTR